MKFDPRTFGKILQCGFGNSFLIGSCHNQSDRNQVALNLNVGKTVPNLGFDQINCLCGEAVWYFLLSLFTHFLNMGFHQSTDHLVGQRNNCRNIRNSYGLASTQLVGIIFVETDILDFDIIKQ